MYKYKISKKVFQNFSTEEKQNFYIKNNIYIFNDWMKKRIPTDKEISENFHKYYHVNPIIYKNMIEDFHHFAPFYYNDVVTIENIKIKLRLIEDKKHKNKIIKKELKKYLKKIQKIELSFYYFADKDYMDKSGLRNFEELIEMEINKDVVDKYIVSEYFEDWLSEPFIDWIDIKKYNNIMEFLKNYNKNLVKETTSKPFNKEKVLPEFIDFFNPKCTEKYGSENINKLKDIFANGKIGESQGIGTGKTIALLMNRLELNGWLKYINIQDFIKVINYKNDNGVIKVIPSISGVKKYIDTTKNNRRFIIKKEYRTTTKDYKYIMDLINNTLS